MNERNMAIVIGLVREYGGKLLYRGGHLVVIRKAGCNELVVYFCHPITRLWECLED